MPDLCTVSDVEALNQYRAYSATSKPTSSQVGDFITQRSATLMSLLKYHGLEYTDLDTDGVNLCKNLCAKICAYDAELDAVGGRAPLVPEKVKMYYQEWLLWIKKLMTEEGKNLFVLAATKTNLLSSRSTQITPKDAADAVTDEPWEPRINMEDVF